MTRIKQVKYIYIIFSAMLLIVGVSLLLWPGISAMTVCYVLGSVLILTGITRIMGYFSKDMYNLNFQFDLALGIISLIIGAVLIFHPGDVVSLLHVVIGIVVIVDSMFRLQTSFDAKHFGLRKWWLMLTAAILCASMGVILIVFPFETAKLLIRLLGITLIINGCENIFMAIYTVKSKKRVVPFTIECEVKDERP